MDIKKREKKREKKNQNPVQHWKKLNFFWVAEITAFSMEMDLLNGTLLKIGLSGTGGSQNPRKQNNPGYD